MYQAQYACEGCLKRKPLLKLGKKPTVHLHHLYNIYVLAPLSSFQFLVFVFVVEVFSILALLGGIVGQLSSLLPRQTPVWTGRTTSGCVQVRPQQDVIDCRLDGRHGFQPWAARRLSTDGSRARQRLQVSGGNAEQSSRVGSEDQSCSKDTGAASELSNRFYLNILQINQNSWHRLFVWRFLKIWSTSNNDTPKWDCWLRSNCDCCSSLKSPSTPQPPLITRTAIKRDFRSQSWRHFVGKLPRSKLQIVTILECCCCWCDCESRLCNFVSSL